MTVDQREFDRAMYQCITSIQMIGLTLQKRPGDYERARRRALAREMTRADYDE